MIIMHHRLVLQTFLEKTNIMEKSTKYGGWEIGEESDTSTYCWSTISVYNIFLVLKEENFMKTTRN